MSIATIIIGAVVAIAAYALGHYSGENRGKAIGWIERNDQEISPAMAQARIDQLAARVAELEATTLARAESTAPKEVLP